MKFSALVFELHFPIYVRHADTDRQTGKHFSKAVKSCWAHPKSLGSVIFTKTIILFG